MSSIPAWLPVVARVLFVTPFVAFGFGHLTSADAMAGMVPVPGGVFWVYFTGVAMLAASVSIVWGRLATIAAPLLALLLLVFAFTLHLPNLSNPESGQMSFMSLMKDLGLAGGALLAWVDALGRRNT